ncbi:claudin-16-like isoform X1 [Acipenser ruthenus]|uniref:claudin-16-like n=2 Tax=Acipenser ruthenus TaxID=7906 RepID=UPI00156079BB|nr:claudin-16-like [Acipenser ruthenus]XP_058849028.1 claudin-16-like isoform X1 [Acipenser ruthenus]
MGCELNLLSVICGAFAVGGTIASLYTDCWQINSKGSVMLSIRCRGLWRECVWDKFVKIWTCDIFSSYLNPHPATIVVTRSLMITSSIASVAAFLCLLLGFRHFHYCKDAMRRRQLQRLAAALYFLVGVFSTGAIIRYCVYVYYIHQYEVSLKIPGFPGFEYGYSLWTAVGATLGALSSAVISTYESCCKKIKNEDGTKEGPSQAKQTISTYV